MGNRLGHIRLAEWSTMRKKYRLAKPTGAFPIDTAVRVITGLGKAGLVQWLKAAPSLC